MADIAYYGALFVVVSEAGDLAPGKPVEKQSATAALSEAQRPSTKASGAVAFSRTGDPVTGEFQDAVVIKSFGRVSSLEDLLAGT